jgi:Polyphosphate kinase
MPISRPATTTRAPRGCTPTSATSPTTPTSRLTSTPVFQQLASLGKMRPLALLLQAPFTLQAGMLAKIAQVAAAAAAGRTARIVVKINALTDAALIEALVSAGQAGAQIDLIVRGACLLAPGAAGLTERIRVRSIVGRFLEHSRVAYFRWGDAKGDEASFYRAPTGWGATCSAGSRSAGRCATRCCASA